MQSRLPDRIAEPQERWQQQELSTAAVGLAHAALRHVLTHQLSPEELASFASMDLMTELAGERLLRIRVCAEDFLLLQSRWPAHWLSISEGFLAGREDTARFRHRSGIGMPASLTGSRSWKRCGTRARRMTPPSNGARSEHAPADVSTCRRVRAPGCAHPLICLVGSTRAAWSVFLV